MKTVKVSALIAGGMLSLTSICGLVLASSYTHADDNSVTDDVSITVPVACTMTGTINTAHNATLNPGTWSGASGSDYEDGIGKTTLTTFCNDYNGFSIYAIGYTGDTDGNNTLVGTSASGGAIIPTKVYESTDTTSNWSMKVTKVTDSSATFNPANMSIANSFDSWHTVPDDYTKVAEYKAQTGSSATDTTLGGKVTTTYAAFISTTQAADTYEGQVKYVMVHPYDHTAPEKPATFTWQEPTATRPADADVRFMMQDFDTATCNLGTTGQIGWVKDSRDNTVYTIGKLADGKCWMLDNLALDLTDSDVLNSLTTTNTNVDSASLTSLKSGNRSAGTRYASSGFATWNSSSSSNVYNQAKANAESKNTTVKSYGIGSGKIGVYYNYCAASAGNYCYDGEAGTGNAEYDICPKGWRMPTGDSSGEYNTLYGYYNTTQTATDPASLQYNLSTPLSGSFYNGSAGNQGSYGYFWSSTYNGSGSMHNLDVNSSDVSPTYASARSNGRSVRCIIGS